jgi:hypothetical protein
MALYSRKLKQQNSHNSQNSMNSSNSNILNHGKTKSLSKTSDQKLIKFPNINIVLPNIHSSLSNSIPKDNVFNNLLQNTNLLTELESCPKYGSTKKLEYSQDSNKNKLINYKSSQLKRVSIIPYKIKEKGLVQGNRDKIVISQFEEKTDDINNNQCEIAKNSVDNNISEKGLHSRGSLSLIPPSKKEMTRHLINDLLSQVRFTDTKSNNSGLINKPIENKRMVDYGDGSYLYIKSKTLRSQFASSVSFPYLMTDYEYLNNLSKENNEKFRINLK